MKTYLIGSLLLISLGTSACGTYEYRKRSDASEVAVIRDVHNVFPIIATEITGILDGFSFQTGVFQGAIGKSEIKSQITQLYDRKDQLNAQLRDFVVARYQSYINAELDPDLQARERGRAAWNEINAEIQRIALDLRKIKQSVEEASQAHADAKISLDKTQIEKNNKKREISKTGKEIDKEVTTFLTTAQWHKTTPATGKEEATKAAYQVKAAKQQLEDAISQEEVSVAKDAVYKIQGGVTDLWTDQDTPQQAKNLRAIKLSHELEKSVDGYGAILWKEQKIKTEMADKRLTSRLQDANDSLERLSKQLRSFKLNSGTSLQN
jgi:hypothetical protein